MAPCQPQVMGGKQSRLPSTSPDGMNTSDPFTGRAGLPQSPLRIQSSAMPIPTRPTSSSPVSDVFVTCGEDGDGFSAQSTCDLFSRSLPETRGTLGFFADELSRAPFSPMKPPGAPSPIRRQSLERSPSVPTGRELLPSSPTSMTEVWIQRTTSPGKLLSRRSSANSSGSVLGLLHPSKSLTGGEGALSFNGTGTSLASRSADACIPTAAQRRKSWAFSGVSSLSLSGMSTGDDGSMSGSETQLISSPSRKDSIQLPRIGENDVLPSPLVIRRTKSLTAAAAAVEGFDNANTQLMRKLSFTTNRPELAGEDIMELSESRPSSAKRHAREHCDNATNVRDSPSPPAGEPCRTDRKPRRRSLSVSDACPSLVPVLDNEAA
eukprot:Opistho-2@57721